MLGEFFQANDRRLEQQGIRPGQSNTAGIAGQLIASGVMPRDAYVQAAQIAHGQEQTNIERQKQEIEQMQKHQYSQLADYVRSNPNASNQEIAAAALQMGVNPANVPAFVNTLGTQERIIEDKLRGGGPTIYSTRAKSFTGSRPAVEGVDTNVGGRSTQKEAAPNAGYNPGEIPEDAALKLAQTPVDQQTITTSQTGKPAIKASTDDFVQFANIFRPKSNEVPTLPDKALDKRNYHKFKDSTIEPVLKATQELDTHLDELTRASKIFETGALADKILIAKKIGQRFGIDNAEEIAAGELIEKASAKMVLDFAKLMKGVVSDKDIAFLNKMVPTLMTTPEGNKQIIDYFKRLNAHNRAYANSASRYYNERKHINDFAEVYDEYTQSQPIFANEIAQLEQQENKALDRAMKLEAVKKAGLL